MAFHPPSRVLPGPSASQDGISPRASPRARRSARGPSPGLSSGRPSHPSAPSRATAPGRSPSPQQGAPLTRQSVSTSALLSPGERVQNAGMNDSSADHRNIVALSQSCTEDLEAKLREKAQLTKYIAELKKKKMAWDSKLTKKRKEVDTTLVHTIDMEKKLHVPNGSNKTVGAEVAGLRTANERETQEVE